MQMSSENAKMKNSTFRFHISGFLFLAALSVSAETLVGELPGEFVVNNLGAASYTVPLNLSPGTAGIEPKLAVSYSSRGDNGLLGMGFSLGGLSVISRGGTSLDQDGFIDGVDFDDNDRFLLDGQRLELVALNGIPVTTRTYYARTYYGAAGSEYRTEIDGFSRIIAYGRSGNGPAYFKVWTKSGLIYEYGNTADSSFKPGRYDEVLRWMVSRISDTAGNYMTFTYEETSAGPQISRIDYTGNTNAALNPYNSVEFVYEERPDPALRFFKGVRMEQTNRLSRIVMKHDGNYLHDYRFTYSLSQAGQSIVESLQQFFGEGAGANHLPPTRFEYSGISAATNFTYRSGTHFLPAGLTYYGSDGGDRMVQGDFNGDGLTDILCLGQWVGSRWLGLSNGDGTFTFTSGYDLLPANLSFWSGDGGDVLLTGDFNGNGLTDIICMGSGEDRRWLGLSNGDGTFSFTTGYNLLPLTLSVWSGNGSPAVQSGDFNGDGLTDIICVGGGENDRWLGLSNGDGTFSFTEGYDLLPSNLSTYMGEGGCAVLTGDFNGDGLTDIVSVGPAGTTRWLGLSNSDGTFSFTEGYDLLPSNLTAYTGQGGCVVLTGDFNGDGLTDIISVGPSGTTRWLGLSNGDGTFTFTEEYDLLPSNLSTYTGDGGCAVLTGDFNGDGLPDICSAGWSENTRWLGLSNGDGTFTFTEGYNLLPSNLVAYTGSGGSVVQAGDFNGDGLTDVYALGHGSNSCWLGLSNGDGTFEFTSGNSFFSGQYAAEYGHYSTGDFNGDGIPDLFGVAWQSAHWIALNGNESTRAVKITQGYQDETHHGVVTEIAYSPITDPDVYVKGSGAEYPVRDIISPIHVVTEIIKDNGQEGTYRTQYAYRSARYHMRGRGFLGFQQFISYDYQTDLCYIETLAHDFPFTGRRLKTETVYIPDPEANPSSPGYSQLIKQVDNTWLFDLVSGGTLFTYNPRSIETKWELGDTNTPVSVVTAYNWFDNQDTGSLPPVTQPTNLYAEINSGNLVKNVIDYGGGLKKTTVNSYDDWIDSTHWMLGRLDESEVRHQKSGQPDIVRSSSFDYDGTTGLLAQEVIEPGDPQFELITDYFYDLFGNIVRKELTGPGIPTRTVEDRSFDTKGRFVGERRNALGHETTFVYDPALGKPLSSTDPNGLTTYWQYDSTGRALYEQRPDGTITTNQYIWDFETTVSIPSGPGGISAVTQKSVYKTVTQASGVPPVTVLFDKQGRKIRTQTLSADGRTVNQDTGYNAIAQPVAVSEPYFIGETPVYTFTEYDGLGRPQYITSPDGTVTETVYNGLSLSVIKDSNRRTTGAGTPKHQVTTSVKNAKGELLSVTDAMSNTVTYVHDAVGNLIRTVDPENNIIEMTYDLRGNKVRQNDPDMGEWFYTYNALDQLMLQTDANGNVIGFAYDLLGRPSSRTNHVMKATGLELESTAAWFYDGTSEGCKLGLLNREEHRDAQGRFINRKRYAYDQYSRPMLELMNYDSKWYYTGLRYDAFGRVQYVDRFWRPKGKEGIEHNLDPQWNVFGTENIYNERGALLEVKDQTGHTWWEAGASDYDAQGRLTKHQYGNGLINTNTYDPHTGRVLGMGIASNQTPISNYQFQYDRIGNLTQRSQSRLLMTTLAETSTYDSLNRLVQVSGDGSQESSSYDALGNILSRSDTGTYLYGGPRPHAVTSAGDCDYFYDANGNVVRRDKNGQYEFTATWNSFNKPVSIFAWDNGSEFEYDVNGRRTRQLIINGTNVVKKVYATPAYEMREVLSNPAETNTALWEWEMDFCRIYVDTPAGKIGIYQHTPGSTPQAPSTIIRSYIHKDHLGSVVAVSGEQGAGSIEFYSYDAWGNRRNASDWAPMSADLRRSTFRSSTLPTDRGFTGHEQLDHLQLVHMNGRIYDPVIGRMLSPDPFIQSPDNLQSFNRYSYVWNNPLSYTDPSGFYTVSYSGSAPSGVYETYIEPIVAEYLSQLDNTPGISQTQDVKVDSNTQHYSDGWYDEDETYYSNDYSVTTVTISTAGATSAVIEIRTEGASDRPMEDLSQYGMGESSGTGSRSDSKIEPTADAAAVSAHVYGKGAELPSHITQVQSDQLKKMGLDPGDFDRKSGMAAGLYHNSETGRYMLAFRGTEGILAFKDWIANISQSSGFKSKQYTEAMSLAAAVDRATKGNFMITGHSLGGGLASAASRATGADAITFNAAGLNSRTVEREYGSGQSSSIQSHRTRFEILSTVQSLTPMPNAAGEKVTHGAERWWYGPLMRHGIDNFRERE